MLALTAAMVGLIAFADWYVGRGFSLGVLYILPMTLGAVVLAPFGTVALAVLCSVLRSLFDTPTASNLDIVLRFVFALLGYAVSGLFVAALVRQRWLVMEHVGKIEQEQVLRREAEEQLRVLVESSPAAILTANGRGVVLAANRAAHELFAIDQGQTLQGRNIQDYLPVFADVLRLETSHEPFRTAAQCQGRRQNGEIFLAHTWFSSYVAPEGKRLAAIAVDASEEMRDREEQNLRQLLECNRIATAAVSHEIRNFCGAIALVCSNLQKWDGLAGNADFAALSNLVGGLQQITSLDLQLRTQEMLEEVRLQEVLDNLRIVIGPDWQEMEGAIRWHLPPEMPAVLADAHGLLQAFLNLARNSHRAVQESSRRELDITVSLQKQKAIVRFQDSGPGIAEPDRLFQPFQAGAEGAGLGLYVSREILRSYGGELRFEPQPGGSCFAVELQAV